mmetsp:Transcript_5391/g.16089  ORF Transcript_5391/g.16089 Transcript_5391/m.16089 type:complete len:91 (+) Transcript_5391:55-327(+)
MQRHFSTLSREAKRIRARQLRSQQRKELIVVYSAGLASIFAGGAVVHRIYKPDLVLPEVELEAEELVDLDRDISALEDSIRQLEEQKQKS